MQSRTLDIEPATPVSGTRLIEGLNWLDTLFWALGFGCLLGLSSPGFDIWWLAWVGLVPLLVLVRGARGKGQAVFLGLVFGLGYQLVALHWLLGLYPLTWLGLGEVQGLQETILVWLVESLHQALLWAGFSWFVFVLPMRAGWLPFYHRPYFPYLVSVPLIWLFFQWIVGPAEAFLGVPVNQLAYSQSGQLDLIQIARLGGSQLVDFLLLLSNATIAAAVIELSGWVSPLPGRCDPISARGGLAVDLGLTAATLAVICCWGHGQLQGVRPAFSGSPAAAQPVIPVAVLQGNIGLEEKYSRVLSAPEISARYMTLGQNLAALLMVLPQGVIDAGQQGPQLLYSQLQNLTRQPGKEVVAGLVESNGQAVVDAVRLISYRVNTQALYTKQRLVPFGEYLPAGVPPSLIPQVVQKACCARENLVQPPSLKLLGSLWGKIGASICVEVVYPRLIADEVRHGASLLVNVSDLSWFHNSTLNRQILAAAVFRAVENGRYLVLSTNTGISAVIDPSGLVTSQSLPGQKGIILDRVQFLYNKTPYTKMWWL